MDLLVQRHRLLGQEEIRSISENVTWGQRKRFADGKVSLPYGRFLGYKRGENGLLEIIESEGKVLQYYVENSHPAIIAPEIFDLVQYEWKQRKCDGRWTSSAHPFSGKVFCGECGGVYGSKIWDSNTEYRRP